VRGVLDKIAGAPISWGISEVPGWGYQLTPGQVLKDMWDLGLTATEFGPDGFLPLQPAEKAAQLRSHGLDAVGGFLPVVLHEAGHDPLPDVDRFIDGCIACGAEIVVLAAATGLDGYDERPALNEQGWLTLLANLDRLSARAESRGVVAALHPHVGTMVERAGEVERVLAGSVIGLCVDTGHLLVGGTDPVALTEQHTGRVTHVHLKDVDAGLAKDVGDGALTFAEAVRRGLFLPLGDGDVDIAGMVTTLQASGYRGWYVLEQDVMLAGPDSGTPPIENVRKSLMFLEALTT
jgi:inosose dehydratase